MHPIITDAVARLHQAELRHYAEQRRRGKAIRAARRGRPRRSGSKSAPVPQWSGDLAVHHHLEEMTR